MKNHIAVLFALSALASCGGRKGEMRITGTIEGMNDAQLLVYSADGAIAGIDTIRVKSGELDWVRPCTETEATYTILYPNASSLTVFGGSGQVVKLEGNARNLSEMKVSGSKANEDYTRIRLESTTTDKADSLTDAYIKANKETILANFLEHERASQQKPASLRPGQKMPKFSLVMRDGKTVGTAQIKGKRTLFVFWASWRGSAHFINNNIRQLLSQHSGELKCISYSLDLNVKQMEDAERYDTITWHSYCEEKGFASKLVQQLGIRDIPYYILVDKKGRIEQSSSNIDNIKDKLTAKAKN